MKKKEPLAGTGLMQSPEEWEARGRSLATTLAGLVVAHRQGGQAARRGLDIGCQNGDLIDQVATLTAMEWAGIDPILQELGSTPGGHSIGPGRANNIPFPDSAFDAVLFANVFEHIPPQERQESLREMFRVLAPGGVVVGQMPNPRFVIESHSRLPLMGILPISWQRRYWRLSPVPWEHDFYVVTLRHLRRYATGVGFVVEHSGAFNYPIEAIPRRVRWAALILTPLMSVYPWSWQFVLRKPGDA